MRSVVFPIFFFLFCTTFIPRAEALVKSSKKAECTVCHVLSMDTFLTDRPTLLESTQTNIVIAGSVGLSSSERICDSCHDGYIKDSRNAINPDNRHHQLRKVPDWLELPEVLRLDINNEIYCGTCHGFHDVRGRGEVGSTPFMRMDNTRSEMCMACHKDKTGELGLSNHPLNKKSDIIPREAVENLGGKLGPDGEVICQSCHISHKKPTLLADLKGSEICVVCHSNKKSIFASDHNMSLSYPTMKNSAGSDASETGPCSSCHLPHKGNGKRMWARKIDKGNPASQACLSCHNLEMWIKTIGTHSHPVDVKTKKKEGLPLFSAQGGEDKNGTVQCATCHDAHTWAASGSVYVKGMEGRAENSFLRITNTSSTLCITCHDDKGTIIGTDHDLRLTAPDVTNRFGLSADIAGPCGSCHMPHKAAGAKLWAGRATPGNPASQMCLSCHGKETPHIQKTIGEYSHPINVTTSKARHAKNSLPLFADNGAPSASGSLQCATCHNPHRWNPESADDRPGRNIEGDSSNSFLRVKNSSESALCQQCHGDKKQVIASDHNLSVTAPDEKNSMGMTAARSGPCGACHVPHNAEAKRLWAKKVEKRKDLISGLCLSCHDENGAARRKKITGNSHPVNVTLSRIKSANDVADIFPLYKDEGDSEQEGKVVCSTCHDPHTWSPEDASSGKVKPLQKNIEGDASNSFLRKANFPDSNLCKTCHTTQALVAGTPHDLSTSAPEAQNILGQTVRESGQCAVCHLVHNSPNSLKLWARPYGPVKKYENRMIGLCTSCHARGRVAENKVQEIANHPKGILTSFEQGFIKVVYDDTGYKKVVEACGPSDEPTVRYTPILVNNVVGFSSGNNYTPLFSNRGREVNVGTISCPSCHDVHVWNRQQKESNGGENADGPAGVKFLRTESSRLVCIECHGPDALFRYLYFHSPSSRTRDGNRHQDQANRFVDSLD